MNTEKPKLAKEQLKELWNMSQFPFEDYVKGAQGLGYMEKQETAFERAERLYSEYETKEFGTKVEKLRFQGDIIEAYREAIKEMQGEKK